MNVKLAGNTAVKGIMDSLENHARGKDYYPTENFMIICYRYLYFIHKLSASVKLRKRKFSGEWNMILIINVRE